MEENTSLHTECAHKPRPAVLNQFSRTELLLGEDNMQRLFNARVAVFGIGGVGGYTVEALARVGVGTLDLIDDDRICLTNLNRQIFATKKTITSLKINNFRNDSEPESFPEKCELCLQNSSRTHVRLGA